jgi:threonine dehydratase
MHDRPDVSARPIYDVLAAKRNRVLHDEFGLVAELRGALALGAVLKPTAGSVGDTAVVIVSGGNVDPALYASVLSAV